MNTSILDPLDRTGKVATFSGGAKLPRMSGPRMGGNGHQSPTTSPIHTIVEQRRTKESTPRNNGTKILRGKLPDSRLKALL